MRQIRSVARAQTGGLSVPQFRALNYVERHPGVGLTELAEHLGVSLPAASALVGRLVGSGLVDRSLDPEERRRIRIVVTESGNGRVMAAMAAVRTWWRTRLTYMGAAELETLIGAMQTLDSLLAPAEPVVVGRPTGPSRNGA
jgi:DNA-binding MarR family transcriptional regulator